MAFNHVKLQYETNNHRRIFIDPIPGWNFSRRCREFQISC